MSLDRIDKKMLNFNPATKEETGDISQLNTTDKSSLVKAVNETVSQLAENTKKSGSWVDVTQKPYNADPTGNTLSTQAFKDAMAYCEANKKNLFVPDGNFWINETLSFPSYYSITGNGYRSNIMVDLPDGESVFKEPVNFRYAWGFENLRFSLKTGASKNTGAIHIESSLRGGYIRNIWSYDLRKPLYLGDQVWGIVAINDLFFYLLNDNLDNSVSNPAIHLKGNTVMMSNVEVIGGWNKGLLLDGVSVFKLNGYNIAGSSSSVQMQQGIHISNSSCGKVTSGWVEQLIDNTLSANGRTVWTNGEGHAIYIKDSKDITVSESNISSGSIYVDNSEVSVDQIYYGQTNAGLRTLNNARVYTTESGVKLQNINGDRTLANGEIILTTRTSNSNGIIDNPVLKLGIGHSLTITNGSFVTLSDEVADYISGDRAIKTTITSSYQGVNINKSNLKIGKLYTCVVKVKAINGLDFVYLSPSSGLSPSTKYPSTLARTGESNYHTLIYTFTPTSTTIAIKLQGILASGQLDGSFLVDAVDIYEGYNVFDPSNQSITALSEQGRLKSATAPTSGAWEVGNKIIRTSPTASGYIGDVCITSGTPGTWKGFGMIQA